MSLQDKLPIGISYNPSNIIDPEEKGGIITSTGITPVEITVGINDQILIADSNEINGLKWGDSLSVIGTLFKADIVTSDGIEPKIYSGIPDNDQVLVADDLEPEGLKWGYPLIQKWTFYYGLVNASSNSLIPNWQTRLANITDSNNSDTTTIVLTGNQFIINKIGNYYATSTQIYYVVSYYQLRIRNITDGTTCEGSTVSGFAGNAGTTDASTSCNISITSVPTVIEFQYICTSAITGGVGLNANITFQDPLNVFASYSFTKII